jgi:hypothetical protein
MATFRTVVSTAAVMTSSSINVPHRDMMFTTDVTIRQLTCKVAFTANVIKQSVHEVVLLDCYLNKACNSLIVGMRTAVPQLNLECVKPVCCI